MNGKQPISIGILGVGRAGWGMQIKTLRGRADFKIAAVCDPVAERLEMAKAEVGCAVYDDYRKFVKDPSVELVSVATRSSDHCRHTIEALKAGKDVLVEKPMALNAREADRMIATAREKGRTLIVRHNRRIDPDFLHVKEIVASGALGKVFRIKLYRQQYQRRDDWQTLLEFGGGQLRNWGPHLIDHALQMMGAPVKRVFGHLNRIAAVGDADDDVKITLEAENGCVADIEISGGDAIGSENLYKVLGTKGALVASAKEIRVKRLAKIPKPIKVNPGTPIIGAGFGRSPKELEWTEETFPIGPKRKPKGFWELIYDAIRKGKPFPATLEQAREVVRVADMVRKGSGF